MFLALLFAAQLVLSAGHPVTTPLAPGQTRVLLAVKSITNPENVPFSIVVSVGKAQVATLGVYPENEPGRYAVDLTEARAKEKAQELRLELKGLHPRDRLEAVHVRLEVGQP